MHFLDVHSSFESSWFIKASISNDEATDGVVAATAKGSASTNRRAVDADETSLLMLFDGARFDAAKPPHATIKVDNMNCILIASRPNTKAVQKEDEDGCKQEPAWK